MIAYENGDYHLGFIWQLAGSTLPKAAVFALPSTLLAMVCRYFVRDLDPVIWGAQASLSSSLIFFSVSTMVGFRCSVAYKRFWDGCQGVQAMSAEWFESCSNLMAFSVVKRVDPNDKQTVSKVKQFQFRLVHLMSLLHGLALRQVGGHDCEDIEVLDLNGLDDSSLAFLTEHCSDNEINRVEVILHWIQVLICESISEGVLTIPAPIITRAFQTLSRGMVNLHNVRRIADIPYPFPLAQATVVFLMCFSMFLPVMLPFFIPNYAACAMLTFVPVMGCWNVVFVCGEMENPFGTDDNDLPLSMQQFEFHTSLMMLVDDNSMVAPTLKETAAMDVDSLREGFGSIDSTTRAVFPKETLSTMREMLRDAKKRRAVVVDHRASVRDSATPSNRKLSRSDTMAAYFAKSGTVVDLDKTAVSKHIMTKEGSFIGDKQKHVAKSIEAVPSDKADLEVGASTAETAESKVKTPGDAAESVAQFEAPLAPIPRVLPALALDSPQPSVELHCRHCRLGSSDAVGATLNGKACSKDVNKHARLATKCGDGTPLPSEPSVFRSRLSLAEVSGILISRPGQCEHCRCRPLA